MDNLLEKPNVEGIRRDFRTHRLKHKDFTDKNEAAGLKTGDIISFYAGYNGDILYSSEILGFDRDGDIYVVWDCYWFPIRPNDTSRQIKVLKPAL